MGRCRRAVLATVVAVVGTTASPMAVEAAPRAGGACTDADGITVVVDWSHFGGGVDVRCAAPPVASGFDALRRAGFDVASVTRFPGFLCRIDGEPSGDPCVNVPPPGAYWAYWHAPRGGDWIYSTSGATRRPPPGSVEGWAFGSKAEPGIAPPAPPAPPTTTTTRPPPVASPTTPTTTVRSVAGRSGVPTPVPGPSTTVGNDEVPTSTTAVGPTGDRPVGDRLGGAMPTGDGDEALGVAAGAQRSSDHDDRGSPRGAIATVVVLVLAAAGVAVWRRTSRPSEDRRGPG